MNTKEVYNQLNQNPSGELNRRLLREYLRDQVDAYLHDTSQGQKVAYNVAGLLATLFVTNLDEGDPYLEALLLAAQLELPEGQREPKATWDAMRLLVEGLPK